MTLQIEETIIPNELWIKIRISKLLGLNNAILNSFFVMFMRKYVYANEFITYGQFIHFFRMKLTCFLRSVRKNINFELKTALKAYYKLCQCHKEYAWC